MTKNNMQRKGMKRVMIVVMFDINCMLLSCLGSLRVMYVQPQTCLCPENADIVEVSIAGPHPTDFENLEQWDESRLSHLFPP